MEYLLGGRLRRPGEGTDCQGTIFYAAERIGRCGWRSFSVRSTETVAWRELGAPVPGMDPVATDLIDTGRLEPGDVLLLLHPAVNEAEAALASIRGVPVWVWHTAIYTGGGRFLHADFISERVHEEPLVPFLTTNEYAGLFVTRMASGPRPRRCRRHRPMRLRDAVGPAP